MPGKRRPRIVYERGEYIRDPGDRRFPAYEDDTDVARNRSTTVEIPTSFWDALTGRAGAPMAVRREDVSVSARRCPVHNPSPATRATVSRMLAPTGELAVDSMFASYQQAMYGDTAPIRHETVRIPRVQDVETEIEDMQCKICFANQFQFSLQCGHVYCYRCIKQIADSDVVRCAMCSGPVHPLIKLHRG